LVQAARASLNYIVAITEHPFSALDATVNDLFEPIHMLPRTCGGGSGQ
jgi:hypothetical protein